jgi:hypothetical protein
MTNPDATDSNASPFNIRISVECHSLADPIRRLITPTKHQHFSHRLAGLVRLPLAVDYDGDWLFCCALFNVRHSDRNRPGQQILGV